MKNYSNNWLATLEAKETKKQELTGIYLIREEDKSISDKELINAPIEITLPNQQFPILQAFN
ncbi:MAG TPA: hypothetical protein VLG67_04695 [Candidatus Saccharimonadales bacterium]|nr:hypothetical protein [Candidatus Saccharimonadales bacterium]